MKSWTPILLMLVQVAAGARTSTEKLNPEIDEATFLIDFKWHNPFHRDEDIVTRHFEPDCEATGTVHAMQYKFRDLDVDLPGGLAPWKDALQAFLARDYPGSWEAIDPGGANRDLLMMEYHDVPAPVREWVEEQHRIPYNDKIWLIGIFGKPKTPEGGGKPVAEGISADKFDEVPAKDKVLIFAPGAMYEVLPLFVAKNAESPGCEAQFRDLSKYEGHETDDGVIAYPIERTKPDENNGKNITVKIKAQHVMESHHGRSMRETWERIYRTARRQNRRLEKQEREAKRGKLYTHVEEEDDEHDEL